MTATLGGGRGAGSKGEWVPAPILPFTPPTNSVSKFRLEMPPFCHLWAPSHAPVAGFSVFTKTSAALIPNKLLQDNYSAGINIPATHL